MTETSISNRDFPVKKSFNDLSFPLSEDVRSHNVTVTGKGLNALRSYNSKRQVCVSDKEAKNLDHATETKTVAGTSPLDQQTLKGKLLEFEFYMQKQGYSEATVKHRVVRLAMLARRGANLQDPESVKTTIALQKTWCDGTKANVVDTYTCFLQKEGLTWNPPRYKRQETIPFIPSEAELNMLIGASGKKLSTFLQGLKETGADPGELATITSKDINKEARTITLNHPVKGHRPRILTVSADLIRRLEAITGSSNRIFNQELLRNNFNYITQNRGAQTRKPTLARNHFHNVSALVWHNGIPQNQRHIARAKASGAQEHPKHADIHRLRKQIVHESKRRVHGSRSTRRRRSSNPN